LNRSFYCFRKATELIIQNIKQASELGKKASDILVRGEAVPETIVAKMIDEKVNSPEVAHHGNAYTNDEYVSFLINRTNSVC
jgi:adenylate/nucleoside-diphosphate kinase